MDEDTVCKRASAGTKDRGRESGVGGLPTQVPACVLRAGLPASPASTQLYR